VSTKAEALRRRLTRRHSPAVSDHSVADAVSMVDAFSRMADRYPDRDAVRYDGQGLSYRELDARSSALASALQTRAGASELVGILLERSADMITAAVGTLKAGMSYLPLDPESPAARLAMILDDAAPAVVVTTRALAGLLPQDVNTLVLDEPLPDARPVVAPIEGSTRAYVIFTSGTTGRPKGVEVTHHNVLRLFSTTEQLFGFGPDDVWTMFHSFAFDFSVWEMWGALLYGGCLVVVPQDVARDPVAFRRLLRDEHVTVLNQTPTAFRSLAAAEDRGRPDRLPLKWVVFGGEALQFPDLAGWIGRYGDTRPELVNMYGITETTVHASYRRVRQADVAQAQSMIGRPLPDLGFVLTDDDLVPVTDGRIGEIVVTGPGVASGYLSRPDLTRERFVRLPGTDVRGYRSGDLARRTPDGDHEYHGRKDDQVKIRGYRIELGEIRGALAMVDSVSDAAVVARDLPGRGRCLVAYIVGDVTPADLRSTLRRVLPEHMVPSAFVFLPDLPRTQNGKVDHHNLPAPEIEAEIEEQPADDVEARILARTAALLAPNPVSRTAGFFDLGGHSLLATRLLAEVNSDFGVDIRLRDFLRDPSVLGLAAMVRRHHAGGLPAARSGFVPLRHDPGGTTPIVALPGILGLGTSFSQLCAHLPGRSFSALYLSDLVGTDDTTADGLIERCAGIVAEAADRPVHLLGHSIGGTLAVHLVEALTRRGVTVSSVSLLDAPSPGWLAGRPRRTRAEHLWYFLGELTIVFPRLAEAWQDELRHEPPTEHALLARAESLVDPAVMAVLESGLTPAFELYVRMNRLHWPAPRPLDVPGLLVRATDGPQTGEHTAGWEPYLSGGLTTTQLQASHESLLHDPHAGDVARIVTRFLASAENQLTVVKGNTA
jgi:amino acid adenylation domain-containing protein